MAAATTGVDGRIAYELPLDRLREVMTQYSQAPSQAKSLGGGSRYGRRLDLACPCSLQRELRRWSGGH